MAKTYGTYKDSGSVWVGDIPSEWNIGNFRYFGEFTKGKLPSTSNTEGIGLPIIGASEMLGKECRTFSEDANVPQCSNDDILILWDGANAGIISSHHKGIVSSTAVKYHCLNSDVDKNFLYYFLKSVEPNFKEKVNGTTIPHMNIKYINEIPLLMPPLSVQQSISSFLDTKCGEIDSLISIQEEMISELLAYKQSVITEAVTKGLDKKAKMKNSGVEWIGDIPEEWKAVPIKHLKANVENAFVDGPFGSNLKSQHFIDNGDVYVIESGFVTSGKFIYKPFKEISLEHFETIKRSECKAGDIIIAKIGAKYGMGAELPKLNKPSVVSGNSLKITLDNTKILNHIFVYLLITAKAEGGYRDLVQENAQPALSLGGLNNFKLPVPPLPVQQAIATYLDEKTSQIDSLIALKQSKIESLKEYKKSIIYEYVTGKKRV